MIKLTSNATSPKGLESKLLFQIKGMQEVEEGQGEEYGDGWEERGMEMVKWMDGYGDRQEDKQGTNSSLFHQYYLIH